MKHGIFYPYTNFVVGTVVSGMMSYAVIVFIVIGLSEMLKRLGAIPSKIVPLFSIILSMCFLLAFHGSTPNRILIGGCVLGIFATGVYSAVKNIIECVAGYLKPHRDK